MRELVRLVFAMSGTARVLGIAAENMILSLPLINVFNKYNKDEVRKVCEDV